MKKRNLLLLIFIGILSLGIYSVSAQMIKSAVKTRRERRAATILEKAEEMAMELSLNIDQKLRIIDIMTKTREDVDKLLMETADKLADLKTREKEEIEAVMTPEQRERFLKPPEFEEEEEDLLKIYRSKH